MALRCSHLRTHRAVELLYLYPASSQWAFLFPLAVYLRDDRGPVFGFAAPTRFFLLQSQTFFPSGHGAIYHRRRKRAQDQSSYDEPFPRVQ